MRTMHVVVITGVLLISLVSRSHAQFYHENIIFKNIQPHDINISCEQTIHIIFPAAIQSVDRGSAWVLAQKASGVDNVLQLKAGRKNNAPTNVSVITGDGEFYSFLCAYAEFPSALNITIEKNRDDHQSIVRISGQQITRAAFERGAQRLFRQRSQGHRHGKGEQLLLTLRGAFIHHELLWLTFRLLNQSHITYDPSHMRFYTRERKRSKRTALQEKEIAPLFCNGDSILSGKQRKLFAATFRPFALPRSQELIVRMQQKDGTRPVTLRVKGKQILRAKLIP